jgi:hypothetical protein
MTTYNRDQIAQLAATLLQHRNIDTEPHHVRKAVQVAKMIVDEVNADEALSPAA